ncbi:MAG: GyrI-like domain-containing protein [Gemmatimonadaceae bacterium]
MNSDVSLQQVWPRSIACVRARVPIHDIPKRFFDLLGQVYSAAKIHSLTLDGQNIFVYRNNINGEVDAEFGVGVAMRFPDVPPVVYAETPSGDAATTTHWGDYADLGGAHNAVIAWCRHNNRTRSGTYWEVYGHWTEDITQRRTDVFYLLDG